MAQTSIEACDYCGEPTDDEYRCCSDCAKEFASDVDKWLDVMELIIADIQKGNDGTDKH